MKNLGEALAKWPSDRTLMVGGTAYQGTMKGDIWTGTATDNDGNVTGIAYNKTTGEWDEPYGLGNIGSAKEGFKVIDSDGYKWKMDAQGNVTPIVTKGGAFDAGNLEGFDEWAASMGGITMPYGGSTVHPNNLSGGEAFHPGYDFAPAGAKAGEYKVTAFMPPGMTGTVVEVHGIEDNPYGKYVMVEDEQGRLYKYSHLDSIGIEMGASVNANTYLGKMGNTGVDSKGNSTVYSLTGGDGTHLDFRTYKPGSQLPSDKSGDEVDWTPTEQKKLESAGMGNASRADQLEYLYPPEEQQGFESSLTSNLNSLAADKISWGDAWNFMFDRYEDLLIRKADELGYDSPNELLDVMLNKAKFDTRSGEKSSSSDSDQQLVDDFLNS